MTLFLAVLILIAVNLGFLLFWKAQSMQCSVEADGGLTASLLRIEKERWEWVAAVHVKNGGERAAYVRKILVNDVPVEHCIGVRFERGFTYLEPGGEGVVSFRFRKYGGCGLTLFSSGERVEVKLVYGACSATAVAFTLP